MIFSSLYLFWALVFVAFVMGNVGMISHLAALVIECLILLMYFAVLKMGWLDT